MEVNLQSENDVIDIMDAKNDNYIESINQAYDEDGNNEVKEDKIRQAVLNVTVPTLIPDAGALAHCGQPILSTCRR